MKKQESSEEMVMQGEKMSTSSTLPHLSEVGDMDNDDNVLPMKKRKRSRKLQDNLDKEKEEDEKEQDEGDEDEEEDMDADDEDEEGTWEEDEMKIMKKIEKKKKQEKKEKKKRSGHAEPHETLLNYLNEVAPSNGKKPVDLANKRKKM